MHFRSMFIWSTSKNNAMVLITAYATIRHKQFKVIGFDNFFDYTDLH